MSCNCNKSNDCNPCNSCGGCRPACYDGCSFQISANPYNPNEWVVVMNGMSHKVQVPNINETDTKLYVNYGNATLNYNSEKHKDIITGAQLGDIIELGDLRNVEALAADSCDLLVFDPGCNTCGEGCKPKPAMWKSYHIPDAGDCEMKLDDNGFYHVLVKDDCGCIKECKFPAVPKDGTVINYQRDSVPDDPDFPWYYGNYNDRINLHLADNYPAYFGKYALKVTINYGVQACKSDRYNYNYNWRSIVVPVAGDETLKTTKAASILQNWAMAATQGSGGGQVAGGIPWGTSSLRGSLVFIVPKGEEAYLHHEFRIRSSDSFPGYKITPKDGQRVPDELAIQLNTFEYPASRLNALQVIVEPISGTTNYDPVVDPYRDQLDPAEDSYEDIV